MGYTHYWYRLQTIPTDFFRNMRSDFARLILPLADAGVQLADAFGEGIPEITDDVIQFNGPITCGHPHNEDIVIPYPSEHAHGIGPSINAIDGDYHGLGVTLRHRCCNGSCAYETFTLKRGMELRDGDVPRNNGLYCEWVKTAFRPYDVAVTAVLLIAKRYLKDQFVIHSNGGDAQWRDARRICQGVLGYGDWFGIVQHETEELWLGEMRPVRLRVLEEVCPPSME
jgi:hypothetical protein